MAGEASSVEHFGEYTLGHGRHRRTLHDAYRTDEAPSGIELAVAETAADISMGIVRDSLSDARETCVEGSACELRVDGAVSDNNTLGRAFIHCPRGAEHCGRLAMSAAQNADSELKSFATGATEALKALGQKKVNASEKV